MLDEVDFENEICRTCLRHDEELKLIHEDIDGEGNIADILNEFTAYKITRFDDLPQQICLPCRKSACNAIKFKRQCEQSYRLLITKLQIPECEKNGGSTKSTETQTDDSTFYPCERCEQKFFSFNALKAHRERDHRGSAIVCRFCDKTFNRIGYLKTHIAIFHPETGLQSHNQCHICERQFTRRAPLRRHLAIIHKILEITKKEASNEEGEESGESDTLNTIPNEQTSDQNESHSSDEDDKPLASLQKTEISNDSFMEILVNECKKELPVSELRNDESTYEQFDEQPLAEEYIDCLNSCQSTLKKKEPLKNNEETLLRIHPCSICKKKFTRATFLRKHMNTKHAASKIIHCEQCNQSFTHSSQYQRHKDTKHSERMHKCGICDKSFTTKIYLQRHINIHEKKRYVCKECTQSYLTKEELNAHVKAEGHDKPLLCPECGLRCKTSNILMVHMRRHNGEKPFKCKFCSKGFPRMDDLRVHEKYHTGEKSHFCETCGKGFQRKYNLTIHLRVHTGEKPYKCQHCPQAFAQGNDLKAHIRRHTGERFRCEICSAAFLQSYQIRQHKLTEHGIKEDPPTQRVAKFTSAEAQEQQIKQNLEKELTPAMNAFNSGENNKNEVILKFPNDVKEEFNII